MNKNKFKSEEEFFAELDKVKKCNLQSSETSLPEAFAFCEKILDCITRMPYCPDHDRLALALYRKGACNHNDAAKIFIPKDLPMEDMTKLTNNIQVPLAFFTHILTPDHNDYKYSWDRGCALAEVWLETQRGTSRKL